MSSTPTTWLDKFFRTPLTRGQSTATGSVSEFNLGALLGAGEVTRAFFLPDAPSTPGTGSNSQTLTLTIYDAAGNALGALATATLSNATPMQAHVLFPLSVTDTGLENYTDGQVVTAKTTGTGTATLPQGIWILEIDGVEG